MEVSKYEIGYWIHGTWISKTEFSFDRNTLQSAWYFFYKRYAQASLVKVSWVWEIMKNKIGLTKRTICLIELHVYFQ